MSFFCPYCEAEIDAPYEWGGMSVACPSCMTVVPLAYRSGQRIAMSASGYGLSFSDFVGLLNTAGWRERTQPLVAQWLSCSIQQGSDAVVLLAADGTGISLEKAHLQIQADPTAQRQLYDLAMNLWR